jgi:D-sedoheptulose 7-phosphate isomerase
MTGSGEPTGFLYPFIEAEERGQADLVADLANSARGKIAQSRELRHEVCRRHADVLAVISEEMARRFRAGARLFAFGNGGSATDADGLVELFTSPPRGEPLPALSLVEDRAVLTALANDVGFDLVFSRQLIAHGRDIDIAVGFSTSGDSINVLRAFEEAHRRGILTIGFSGYDGGAMAATPSVDNCLIVSSDSVHRIQEAQDALVLQLWATVQRGMVAGTTEITEEVRA